MKILCIGDVVGAPGRAFLRRVLPRLKKQEGVDLTISNGENAADKNGVSKDAAEQLFSCGVDVITLGNHAFRRKDVYDYLDENPFIVRPLNYPPSVPGRGWTLVDLGYTTVAVVNLMGQENITSGLDNPFVAIDRALKTIDADVILVDFHAEATSEKRAMGLYLDGRVSAVFGTHTHVQTADEEVLALGTGYITDLGMTGVHDSVLGVKKEIILRRFSATLPERFLFAEGECRLDGAIFELDPSSKTCVGVKRIRIFEKDFLKR